MKVSERVSQSFGFPIHQSAWCVRAKISPSEIANDAFVISASGSVAIRLKAGLGCRTKVSPPWLIASKFAVAQYQGRPAGVLSAGAFQPLLPDHLSRIQIIATCDSRFVHNVDITSPAMTPDPMRCLVFGICHRRCVAVTSPLPPGRTAPATNR